MQSKNGHHSKAVVASSGAIAADEDIAIIGMACRFPGGVMTPQEYWEFLLAGGDGIVAIPGERWDSKAYYDPDRTKKNRMYVDRGGFIGGLDQFDPIFFGISPAEASQIDPQHRWLLEVTYEALENAGLSAAKLRGSDTAVYIGQFMHDYEQLQLDGSAHGMITSHSATGPSMTLTANRISYVFDFRGPSVSLDTACSSSLVALDLACKALLHGDAELAVAGGVNLLLRPELTMAICKASMLSPDGRCKSFDASANGYVRSEGAGVVLVKRLSKALQDGNQIWAVIRASGVNQDGHTVGITVPSGAAQEALLRRSLRRAGLRGRQIQYAEAHGTGTAVGDPIEVNALGAVLGEERSPEAPFILGSVKSNIGHLESAAGVAGLMKTVLALNHGVIPQNLHYETVNPKIDLQALNCRVADRALPWPETDGEVRRAIVNSFGFGGTNANVIVEQAPPLTIEMGPEAETGVNGPLRALVLSAKTEAALVAIAGKYLAFMNAQLAAGDLGASLPDICYSAACAREHHRHRVALMGATLDEVRGELDRFLQGVPSPSRVHGTAAVTSTSAGSADAPARLCFVYSGMGTQWLGMGRELYVTEPVFRRAFERCSLAFEKLSGWSLTERVLGMQPEGHQQAAIDDTAVAQPAIFTIQVALTELLESWGVRPSAVVGHSAGEVCAAYAAGALSFEDSVLVAYHRSRLQAQTEGTGTMLAVALRAEQAADYLIGIEDRVSIGAINGQDAITLSGEHSALERIQARLEAEGVFARFLNVGVPYHSPVMDRLEQPLLHALREIRVLEPRVALYSTVSGKRSEAGDWAPEYWFRNVRQPVLFQAAIEAMERDGLRAFLEVSPHAALASSIQKNLERLGQAPIVASTSKRNTHDAFSLMRAMATLHVQGFGVSWHKMYARGARFVTLPNYAWQHAAYWYESDAARRARLSNVARHGNSLQHGSLVQSSHPLAGARLNSGSELWQNQVDLNEQAYLADHQLDGEPVFPAAGYVEMALLLAKQAKGEVAQPSALALEDLEFSRVLFLDRERATPIEMIPVAPGARELVIRAFDSNSGSWSVHSSARISDGAALRSNEATPAPAAPAVDLNEVRARCGNLWQREEFYEHCHRLGLSYRGFFQVVTGARFEGDEVLTELSLPDSLHSSHAEYLLHPVLLDGGFQGLFAVANQGYVPVRIAELRYHRRPPTRLYCHIRITDRTATGITGDVTLLDEQGAVCVEVIGMESTATARQSLAEAPEASLLYAFDWQRCAEPDNGHRQGESATAQSATAQSATAQSTAAQSATAQSAWIVLADADDLSRGGDAQAIVNALAEGGHSVTVIVPEAGARLGANGGQARTSITIEGCADGDLDAALQSRIRACPGIIFARSLRDEGSFDRPSSEAMLGACRDTVLPALHLAQALGRLDSAALPPIYFVTRSAQRVESGDYSLDPAQSALWGFVRVFGSEYPGCSTTLVDTDGTSASAAAFVRHLRGGEYEQELAFRDGVRFVNRLHALHDSELAEYAREPYLRAQGPFTWTGSRPSPHAVTSEQTLVFQRSVLSPPAAGRANVAIDCAALSKLELEALLAANSDTGSHALERGYACVATIAELPVGYPGELRVGDQVLGFVESSLGSHGQVRAELLVRKPKGLSCAEAALLPTAWLSAWYALSHMARLRAGQTLFLYEPSGAEGLAAAQLARWLGVRVLASSSQESMRERLEQFGVEWFDSRAPKFVESVLAVTQLRGVDGVLTDAHRLASDPRGARAIRGLVRPLGHLILCGRVAELDANQLGSVLQKSVNFSIADVSILRDEQPELCRTLLGELAERFERKQLVPLEAETFSWSEASQALGRLVVTNQVGWMGLTFEGEAPLLAGGIEANVIRADGTYLVTGGLGGLGLEVMRWLATEGSRSIVLVGRSEPSLEARLAIEAVRGQGVSVTVVAADVSVRADVARVLRTIEAELPPLRGILHAAGVLDDGLIAQQSEARLLKVLTPKVQGAWNLHQQTLHLELELFVLFSSIASVVGWAGQSNYAAGNAFMDALAQYRRARGLKALSVNWGPWGGSGMAANLDERSAQRMREAGLSPLMADAAMTAMRRLLSAQVPQAGVFEIDWASLFQFEADPARKTVFRDLLPNQSSDSQVDLKQQLCALDEPGRSSLVSGQVRQQLAGVLGLESGAALDASANVFDYGLNSLMAMDLVNRLQAALQMKLPATLVLKHPTVDAMTRCIVEQLRSSEAPLRNQHVYWDPESSVSLTEYELNGRLATITPTVLQLMFEEHTAHFNVGMLVEIEEAAFDLKALKAALNVLFTYHDGCRLRIFAEGGQMQQEIAPLGAGVDVEEHDLRGLGYEAGAARMLELNEALHRSLTFTREGPLYRAAHYQLDGHPRHRFFLMFHHYVSDGWSQKLLSRELGLIYNKIARGKPVLLPAKGYSLFDWTRRFKDFAYGEAVDQIPYWLEQLKAAEGCEIIDEIPGQREPAIDDYVGESGVLERDEQLRISEYCKAQGVELADVATYALVRAFAALTRSDALWTELITHARAGIFPDVTLPDLFGQISESGAVLFRLRPGASHLEQIAAVREQRQAAPNAGLGLRALRLINQDPQVKSQILLRHAPQVGLNIDVTDYAEEASQETGVRFAREPFGTASAQHQRKSPDEVRLAFFVALRQSEGRLILSVDFYRNRFKSETIRRIIDSALDLLLEIAAESESGRPVSTPPPAFSADTVGLATAV